ncbi:MAG: hypothetical protein HY675_17805 [Chloroflexi bacterium]|nr:hypothetical protein [Chloroflexota bacterium]
MSARFNPIVPSPNHDPGDVSNGAIFLVALLLLGAIGAVLFTGTSFLVPNISFNPITGLIGGKAALPADIASTLSTTTETEITVASEEPTPPEQEEVAPPRPTVVRVANTDGDGVYLRRTPRLGDRIVAWPDNTQLEVVGDDVEAEGLVWRNVKDPRGNVGFVPDKYVVGVEVR